MKPKVEYELYRRLSKTNTWFPDEGGYRSSVYPDRNLMDKRITKLRNLGYEIQIKKRTITEEVVE